MYQQQKSATLTDNTFSYFLKINKYSWAINKKLYFTLFVFQYPVALQLCCCFIISSFNVEPTCWKILITSKDRGTIQPFFLVSPIRMAQNLSFFSTRKHSSATLFISRWTLHAPFAETAGIRIGRKNNKFLIL